MRTLIQVHAILRHALYIGLILFVTGQAHAQLNSTQQSIELPSGDEITAEVFAYDKTQHGSKLRVLWIAPSFGIHQRHRQVADALARNGMEVWQVDLADALFLPRGAQTMRDIPGTVVAELITALSNIDQSRILIVSNSYGAIPTLRGIHAWQSQQPDQAALIGAILFTPYFYTRIPSLGSAPTFIPELSATSVPLYIFQASKNGNRWHLPAALESLQQNAPVYSEIFKGVTSLFYEKDTAPETLAKLEVAPELIQRALELLRRHDVPRQAMPLPKRLTAAGTSGLDAGLKPYRGSVKPAAFSLADINGKPFNLGDYKGRVTLINFWASWCPPCVEEIPSLNRLKQKMQGQPFRLISINYAESPERIRDFLKSVAVDFPVLLDPDGQLAGQWNVVAFPSTFVIGPDGKIHYGVNAAIHWDTDEVTRQLIQLLENP